MYYVEDSDYGISLLHNDCYWENNLVKTDNTIHILPYCTYVVLGPVEGVTMP